MKWIKHRVKAKTVFIPFVRLSRVAGAVVRGPWWCCGVVVMQPAYTTTPYAIHYRGSLIKFNIRARTSYHTTILCTAAVYPVPRSGCCVFLCPVQCCAVLGTSYSERHVQRTRLSGLSSKHRDNSGNYTVIYRYSILWNTEKYRNKIPVFDFLEMPENAVKIP